MKKANFLFCFLVFSTFLFFGCGALKSTPHMGFEGIKLTGQLDRNDFAVLDRVEGSSSTTSVFFGIVQVIDGEGLKIFWIPFYKVKEAYPPLQVGEAPVFLNWFVSSFVGGSEKRAYYKALEATTDADVVLYKSLTTETSGIPLIYSTKKATYTGKALKLITTK